MSVKAFIGFDHAVNASPGTTNAFVNAEDWASLLGTGTNKTFPFLFHNRGVSTLNKNITGPNTPANASTTTTLTSSGNHPAGGSTGSLYWPGKAGSNTTSTTYTGATTVTRATWATARGQQLGLVRSLFLPSPLNADEYWFSFEAIMGDLGTTSKSSSFSPTATWAWIFNWGDVGLKFKESTYLSGTGANSLHDIVFSVMNNGSEVATITVPSVKAGTDSTASTYLFCLVHVKLHSTQGIIEMSINGNAQSVAYTNQNTVQTTPEASATAFYIGPPIHDDGTTATYGGLDAILIDDAEFPAGRPFARLLSLSSVSPTLVNATEIGTNIFSSAIDANALRFTAFNGTATYDTTDPTITSLLSDVLGVQGLVYRAANRYPQAQRRVTVGPVVSSTFYEDEYCKSFQLPFSSVITHPETNGLSIQFFVPDKGSGVKFQTSELAGMQIRFGSRLP